MPFTHASGIDITFITRLFSTRSRTKIVALTNKYNEVIVSPSIAKTDL